VPVSRPSYNVPATTSGRKDATMTLPDRHPTINRGLGGVDVDVDNKDDADDEDNGAAVEHRLVACPNGSLLS
jgi:hypothetical protein